LLKQNNEQGHDKVLGKSLKGFNNPEGFDLSPSYEKYATNTSGYGTTDTREYVAESFVDFFYGNTKNLDPGLVKLFEDLQV